MDNDTLSEIFAEQAAWRDGKSAEYADDGRNKVAANHFRMLATSANNVDQLLIVAAEELHEDVPDAEVWNEMLRTIGFSYFPSSAQQFLEDFISNRASGR